MALIWHGDTSVSELNKEIDCDLRAEFAKLTKDELIDLLAERRPEGTRYVFAGKANARRIVRLVRPRGQRYVTELSVGDQEAQARNLVIEGECLQAMVSLHKYHGAIDLIIADPPYNTGSDFRYNDRWEEDPNDPEPGELVKKEDGSRFTKWARFMLPRLYMMRTMLRPGGVVAICIDDNELFQLGLMLDEVFGEDNRIGIVNWQKSYGPKNDSRHLSTATEYVLVYAKDKTHARTSLLARSEGMDAAYKNPDNDPKGPWSQSDATTKDRRDHDRYGVQNPFNGSIFYPSARSWGIPKAKFKELLEAWGSRYIERDIKDGRAKALVIEGAALPAIPPSGSTNLDDNPVIHDESIRDHISIQMSRSAAEQIRDDGVWPRLFFRAQGEANPRVKRYLNDVKKGKVPMTYWADEDYDTPIELGPVSWDHEESGHSQTGINELNAIVGKGHGFETVKPLKLFVKLIQLWCPSGGKVLDPFAGSGTTGHAVLELNYQAEADREFILIEQGNRENKDRFARTLTADRLRRVVSGDWALGKATPLEGGFRFHLLTQKVDAKAVLAMQREELIDLLLSTHWDKDRRNRPRLVRQTDQSFKHLIATDGDGLGYFLLWKGDPTRETSLDYEIFAEIVKEARKAGLKPPYVVYARFETYQTREVRFFKIPDRVLLHMGISDSRDPYNDDEDGQ